MRAKANSIGVLIDTDDSDAVTYHGKDIGVMKDIGKMMQRETRLVCQKLRWSWVEILDQVFAMSPRSSSPKILLLDSFNVWYKVEIMTPGLVLPV